MITFFNLFCCREGDIATNRGNNLLLKLLHHRYPELTSSTESLTTLTQWVSEDSKMQGLWLYPIIIAFGK